MTVGEALEAARRAGLARLDAQLLLGHVLGRPREWLLAHDDEPLDAPAERAFADVCARRGAGEPVAYVLGRRAFRDFELEVGPGVLVPRPETEHLVDWALERLAALAAGARAEVADLGTGSGAIALALAAARPGLRIVATDRSTAALAIARRNGGQLGLDVEWREGDWWEPLGGRRFDLVASNPPYIAAGDPHLAALRHEPAEALTPGGDGLGALRTIVAGAPGHLRPGGWLLLEHGHDQGGAARALLLGAGFVEVATRDDLAGLPRCTGGRHPG